MGIWKSLSLRALPVMGALSLVALSACGPQPEPPVNSARIILVGDSTTAPNNGWGDAFCAMGAPSVACINLARNGRSSKSFRAEGLWDEVLERLAQEGPWQKTYVFIQFGHNDQPGKGERSSDLATEFIPNLTAYVEDVRSAGAEAVLITPLTRRDFRGGIVNDKLAAWAAATRKAADQTGAPLLDLFSESIFAVQTLGPVRSLDFAEAPPPQSVVDAAETGTTAPTPRPGPDDEPPYFDYTHLGEEGGAFFAAIILDEVRSELPEIANLFEAP